MLCGILRTIIVLLFSLFFYLGLICIIGQFIDPEIEFRFIDWIGSIMIIIVSLVGIFALEME